VAPAVGGPGMAAPDYLEWFICVMPPGPLAPLMADRLLTWAPEPVP
jgi:hypothetical protein